MTGEAVHDIPVSIPFISGHVFSDLANQMQMKQCYACFNPLYIGSCFLSLHDITGGEFPKRRFNPLYIGSCFLSYISNAPIPVDSSRFNPLYIGSCFLSKDYRGISYDTIVLVFQSPLYRVMFSQKYLRHSRVSNQTFQSPLYRVMFSQN